MTPSVRSQRRSSSAPGTQPGPAAGGQVAGADAEHGRLVVGGDLPQPQRVGVRGAAVVEHDRRADQQAGRDDVPHHPVGARVPEQRPAGAEVEVQPEHLAVLGHDAAVAVDDPLRAPGGPGGEQHPQRRVEVGRLDPRLRRRGDGLFPAQALAGGTARRGRRQARGSARGRSPAARAAAAAAPSPPRAGRVRGRSTGSRRRRRGRPGRAGRTGRRPRPPRSPARTPTTPRRCSRWRGTR